MPAAPVSAPCCVPQMIVEPELRVADFAKAGADIISVHAEQSSTIHLHRVVYQVRAGATWPYFRLLPPPLLFFKSCCQVRGRALFYGVGAALFSPPKSLTDGHPAALCQPHPNPPSIPRPWLQGRRGSQPRRPRHAAAYPAVLHLRQYCAPSPPPALPLSPNTLGL
jgi:hypothetical protein